MGGTELQPAEQQLKAARNGRKFTPDGHLVGSLGEVLASYYYELEIPTASAERHVRRNP